MWTVIESEGDSAEAVEVSIKGAVEIIIQKI